MSTSTFLLLTSLFLLRIEHTTSYEQVDLIKENGTITTTLTKGRYSNNLHMVYNVKVPDGNRAKLNFTSFDVSGQMPNCTQDSLEIFVG